MNDLNKWKTLWQTNINLFDRYYPQFLILDDTQRSRFGFYIYILSIMFEMDNKLEIEKAIIDTDFNKAIIGTTGNDQKVDSVYIDHEDKKIYLLNFKYREKFKEEQFFSSNEVDGTLNFLNLINDDDFDSNLLNYKKLKDRFDEIRSIINDSSKIYEIHIYFISNENKAFSDEAMIRISSLEKTFGVIIHSINLHGAYDLGYSGNIKTNAKLYVKEDKLSLFKIDEYTTISSYIINLSLFELLRITCSNPVYRDNTELIGDTKFDMKSFSQEKAQLNDNVRGYLGLTDYNKNIINTLENDTNNFFFYNNGITIICENLISQNLPANRLYELKLENIQIVNGGQTVATLYYFLSTSTMEDITKKLKNTYILLRIFNIPENDELKLNIAQYTNSQNAIDNIDLKSVDRVQVELEHYLNSCDIQYLRKRGSVPSDNYKYFIRSVSLGQLICAFKGYPDRSSNQKKRIFNEYYKDVFVDDFDMTSCQKLIELYYKITNTYEKYNKNCELSEVYYVIYLISNKYENFSKLAEVNIDKIESEEILGIICSIEKIIDEYLIEHDNIARSRVYIKKDFKDKIDTIEKVSAK